MAKPRVGALGESLFEGWCHDVGLVPNGAKTDEKGWDFVVEFPTKSTVKSHFGTKESAPEATCRVQVKTTRDRKRSSWRVKLSNLRALATNPLPAFYVLITLKKKDPSTVKSVRVVHVEDALIRRVQSRIWELRSSAGANGVDLAKHKLSISFAGARELSLPYGKALRRYLREAIGDPHSYAASKLKWLSAEPTEVSGLARLSLPSSYSMADCHRAMAEFAVGLRDTLPATLLAREASRFGSTIPVGQGGIELSGVFNHVDLPGAKRGELIIALTARKSVRLPVDMFFSHTVFPQIPTEAAIVRFSNPVFDLIWHVGPSHLDWNLTLHPTDQVPLYVLAGLVELTDHLKSGGAAEARLRLDDVDQIVDLGPLAKPTLSGDLSFLGAAVELCEVFTCLDIPTSTPVLPAGIEAHSDRVSAVRRILQGQTDAVTATFPVSTIPTDESVRVGIPFPIVVPYRTGGIVVAIGVVGNPVAVADASEPTVTLRDASVHVAFHREELSDISGEELNQRYLAPIRDFLLNGPADVVWMPHSFDEQQPSGRR